MNPGSGLGTRGSDYTSCFYLMPQIRPGLDTIFRQSYFGAWLQTNTLPVSS